MRPEGGGRLVVGRVRDEAPRGVHARVVRSDADCVHARLEADGSKERAHCRGHADPLGREVVHRVVAPVLLELCEEVGLARGGARTRAVAVGVEFGKHGELVGGAVVQPALVVAGAVRLVAARVLLLLAAEGDESTVGRERRVVAIRPRRDARGVRRVVDGSGNERGGCAIVFGDPHLVVAGLGHTRGWRRQIRIDAEHDRRPIVRDLTATAR